MKNDIKPALQSMVVLTICAIAISLTGFYLWFSAVEGVTKIASFGTFFPFFFMAMIILSMISLSIGGGRIIENEKYAKMWLLMHKSAPTNELLLALSLRFLKGKAISLLRAFDDENTLNRAYREDEPGIDPKIQKERAINAEMIKRRKAEYQAVRSHVEFLLSEVTPGLGVVIPTKYGEVASMDVESMVGLSWDEMTQSSKRS